MQPLKPLYRNGALAFLGGTLLVLLAVGQPERLAQGRDSGLVAGQTLARGVDDPGKVRDQLSQAYLASGRLQAAVDRRDVGGARNELREVRARLEAAQHFASSAQKPAVKRLEDQTLAVEGLIGPASTDLLLSTRKLTQDNFALYNLYAGKADPTAPAAAPAVALVAPVAAAAVVTGVKAHEVGVAPQAIAPTRTVVVQQAPVVVTQPVVVQKPVIVEHRVVVVQSGDRKRWYNGKHKNKNKGRGRGHKD